MIDKRRKMQIFIYLIFIYQIFYLKRVKKEPG